jgi:CRP/FNR family cyclic AMP-dependent transcriptional regulator
MELGADDYINKPFDGTELLTAVEMRLKKTQFLKEHLGTGNNNVSDFITNVKQSGGIQLISDEREVYDYMKKQMIYAEGQRPKAVYYVMSGKVKIYKASKEGKELITGIFGEGDFFGYAQLLEQMSYTENAQVLDDA